MNKITKEQYKLAQERVEALLPQVDDSLPLTHPLVVELTLMSDVVIAYEKEHFPIETPTVAELIASGIEETGITQKQLAEELGVSSSCICDFITGKTEPSLRLAGILCKKLHINPSMMLAI